MTLKEIKTSDKIMLTAQDVSPVVNCDPQTLRLSVRNGDPVGFNCSMIGKSLRIPRMAFLNWIGDNPEVSLADVVQELKVMNAFLGQLLKDRSLFRYEEAMKTIREVTEREAI